MTLRGHEHLLRKKKVTGVEKTLNKDSEETHCQIEETLGLKVLNDHLHVTILLSPATT